MCSRSATFTVCLAALPVLVLSVRRWHTAVRQNVRYGWMGATVQEITTSCIAFHDLDHVLIEYDRMYSNR